MDKQEQIDDYFFDETNFKDDKNVDNEKLNYQTIMEYIKIDQIKFKELIQYLQQKRIIPDQARGLLWRIILNYLPPNRKLWIEKLETNTKHYEQLVDEYIISKIKKGKEQQQIQNLEDIKTQKNKQQITFQACQDHPLNRKNTSSWNNHFQDLELWNKIQKDTNRTRREYYQQKCQKTKLYNGQIASLLRKNENEETYQDVITRILFLFTKLNPQIGYIQGMNEIIGLLYQCFNNEKQEYLKEKAESDAFYCFIIIMTKIKQMFNVYETQNDYQKHIIEKFLELFRKVDNNLYLHFKKQNIDPKHYCLRWMLVFFCQDFHYQQALQIWDSLILTDDIVEFVNYICVAILYINRDELLQKNYSEILIKLQNISDMDIEKLTRIAFNLYNQYSNK